jgi:hypothetical protein
VDSEKTSIVRQQPVNTFSEQPKHTSAKQYMSCNKRKMAGSDVFHAVFA